MAAGLPAAAGEDGAGRPDPEHGQRSDDGDGPDPARTRARTPAVHDNGDDGDGGDGDSPGPGLRHGDAEPAGDAPEPRPDGPGATADSAPTGPDEGDGGDASSTALPDEGGAGPTTAGRRLAGWLRTVPGLAASTVVTTLAAAAATAVFTGALHLWPESSKVSLSVETDPLRLDAEGDLTQLLPAQRFDHSEPQDGCAGFWAWARARGGLDEDRTRMQLTVTNSGSSTVLITGMRAEVISRSTASSVVEAQCRTQGEATVYSVDIDLDKPRPYGVYDKGGKSLRPDFTVAAGDLETFLVTARISHGAARWKLAVDLVEDGHKRTIVVGDGGEKPFTTVTRPAAVTTWELDPHGGGWHRTPGGGSSAGRSGGTS